MRVGIRARLTGAFLLVALLVPAAALVLQAREARQEFRADFQSRTARLREAVRGRVDAVASDLSEALERISRDPLVQYLGQDLKWGRFYGDPKREREVMKGAEQLMTVPALDVLELLDGSRDGQVVALGHRRGSEPPDRVAMKVLRSSRNMPIFREVAFDQAGELLRRPTIQVIRPASDGVVLVGGRVIDEAFLRELAAGAGGGVEVALLGADGRILASTAKDLEADESAYETEDIVSGGPDGGELGARFRLYVPRAPLLERQASLVRVTAQVGAAAAAFALLLGFGLARRITRPIGALADAARAVAGGDEDVVIPGRTRRDEVGDLVVAFNTMTRERRESRERAVRAERIAAWKDIARRIAHEIKNPLFPIQTSIETLQRARIRNHPEFDEIFVESTQTILEEVERMKRIVTEFSQFARMPPPSLSEVDVAALAAQVARLYGDVAPDVAVRVEMDGAVPTILADPEQLSQVLGNFVQNGIDATSSKGGGVVVIRARVDSEAVELMVDDEGPGIPVAYRETVFTPYFTKKEHGTGLGLAIAQRIATDHGGSVRAEEAPSGGARLVVRLPIDGPAEGMAPAGEEPEVS